MMRRGESKASVSGVEETAAENWSVLPCLVVAESSKCKCKHHQGVAPTPLILIKLIVSATVVLLLLVC